MPEWHLDVTRRELSNQACIIFIHGFTGKAATTWTEFSNLLCVDSLMDKWDVLSFGYESSLAPDLTGIWEGDPPIQTIADSLGTFASTNLYRYGALAFIAHSMGGLVVQRALLDYPDLTGKVDKVILFGTPSFGLIKAWPSRLPLLRSLFRQVRDMEKNSIFITKLRSDWSLRFGANQPFDFLAVAGSEDEFVPRSASIDGFPDDQCAVVPGNHITIVKPKKSGDASLDVVLKFIGGGGVAEERWGTSMLALERRQFQKVIDRLLPNSQSLDERALVDLALALDALDRRDDAMEILAQAELRGTDAMGVLAGRHKRIWLKDRIEGEALKALALYGDAYERSQTENAAQAYYHGINLAFMALIFENDLAKARDLAVKVLHHCADAKEEELPKDRMWRLATEGEANLILGNFEIALQGYQGALDGPPKPEPWQFMSTSQQALRIADFLGDEQLVERLLELFKGGQS